MSDNTLYCTWDEFIELQDAAYGDFSGEYRLLECAKRIWGKETAEQARQKYVSGHPMKVIAR